MAKKKTARKQPVRVTATPLTDEEIARSQAVEVNDQNVAVQSLRIGRPFTSAVDGNSYGANIWSTNNGTQWGRLESIGVLEVRQASQDLDLRVVDQTGVSASYIDNTPDYYSWQYIVVPKNYDTASLESQDRVFVDLMGNLATQTPAISYAYWKRSEGGEPGFELNPAAAANVQLLENAWDNYTASIIIANPGRDLRDIVAAEDTFIAELENLQTLQPEYV